MNEKDRTEKVDRVAWGIMWFLLTVLGSLAILGVVGLASLVF
jgi:hypothetical protein